MKFSVNGVIQLIGTLAQTVNALGAFVPDKQKVYVAAALAALQGLSAVLAHFSNPDGTPASVAYTPSK